MQWQIISHLKAIYLHELTLSQLGGYHSRNTTEILGVGASFSLQAARVQHCSIQAGLQIYGRQVTVAQKVRLQLGESDGNSADVQQHKQKKAKNVKVNKGECIDNSADWRILRIWVLCGRDL